MYGMGPNGLAAQTGKSTIEAQAFSSCYALKEITLPATVTTIGNSIF